MIVIEQRFSMRRATARAREVADLPEALPESLHAVAPWPVGNPAVAHLRAGRHVAAGTHMELGLVILRTVVGCIIAAHGAQKLFGWFGGRGIAGTGAYFEALGFRPGSVMASMAGIAESIGGASLAVGLLTPFAAALVLSVMIVAIASAHAGKGLFTETGGSEYPLTIAAVATALAFSGPGAFSLDRLVGLSFAGAKWGLVAIVLAVAGALPPLLGRATNDPPEIRQSTGVGSRN